MQAYTLACSLLSTKKLPGGDVRQSHTYIPTSILRYTKQWRSGKIFDERLICEIMTVAELVRAVMSVCAEGGEHTYAIGQTGNQHVE